MSIVYNRGIEGKHRKTEKTNFDKGVISRRDDKKLG
jgi:hypothetical protein